MFTDRYLQIADYPMLAKTLAYKRQQDYINERRRAVWRKCETMQQFMRGANISEGMAKRLDKQFSSYIPDHRLSKEKSPSFGSAKHLASLDVSSLEKLLD